MQELVAEIIALWRRADRLAATLPEGTVERHAARRAAEQLGQAIDELTHAGVAPESLAVEADILLADATGDRGPDEETGSDRRLRWGTQDADDPLPLSDRGHRLGERSSEVLASAHRRIRRTDAPERQQATQAPDTAEQGEKRASDAAEIERELR